MRRRRWRRGAMSSPSSEPGVAITVRPDGKRRINLPSDVMPTNRARIEPRISRGSPLTAMSAARVRLDGEATLFFVLGELDSFGVAGCDATFACADEVTCS